jgi:hypothetical protein
MLCVYCFYMVFFVVVASHVLPAVPVDPSDWSARLDVVSLNRLSHAHSQKFVCICAV